jgi:hypothetical protein
MAYLLGWCPGEVVHLSLQAPQPLITSAKQGPSQQLAWGQQARSVLRYVLRLGLVVIGDVESPGTDHGRHLGRP